MYKLLLLLFPFAALSQSGELIINGSFKNAPGFAKLHIWGTGVTDSVSFDSAKHTFRYVTKLNKPTSLNFTDLNTRYASVWAVPGTIDIVFEDVKKINPDGNETYKLSIHNVSGPPETMDACHLMSTLDSLFDAKPKRHVLAPDPVMQTFYPFARGFINQHPGSGFGYYVASLYNFGLAEKKNLFAALKRDTSNDDYNNLKIQISRMEKLRPGTTIEDFVLSTPSGERVSLYAISKPYTLIEFWSSWCGPCRAEHPHYKELYEKYKDKGFEILEVSIDDESESWIRAIKDDQITWPNVSDLQGWNNFLVKKFHINYIPFNILVDANHKVIASGIWASQMKEILALPPKEATKN